MRSTVLKWRRHDRPQKLALSTNGQASLVGQGPVGRGNGLGTEETHCDELGGNGELGTRETGLK